MDFKPGGYLPTESSWTVVNTHPWKCIPMVPLNATPEQIRRAATVLAFQDEIDLIDTSALDEL
ncbi:hypothetical protein OHB04_02200 [Streptomyces sp. NBC_01775]|uniref:hypothetical protein n=1 Tax=Streptomyces sp. NBC_01775 TaxID=2975939 RepID=UPI002DDC678F|nr:hypothetical protein [Streptomyces sp. NBC_01775]WSB74704.1 hypothetical protein OHB04_02200 [Streptomyces sp. NBC_01775]